MSRQTYSITRTRASFKPRVTECDLPFFESGEATLLGVAGGAPAAFSGSGSTAVFEAPYAALNAAILGDARAAGFVDAHDVFDRIELDYRIDGGFNANCIIVTWNEKEDVCRLEWACLKTFTGMQLKYAMPGKRRRLVFALADEDAFAYCNKEPCEECGFRCKSGFALYAHVHSIGIVRLSLDRISTSEILSGGRRSASL